MKKFIYSFIVVGFFTFYALFQNRLAPGANLFSDEHKIIAPSNLQQPITDSTNSNQANSNTSVTKTPNSPPKGQYRNGSYTGVAADAYYGNIQVKAIISGGKITDVVFLQYPNDRSTSRAINGQAMPYLKQEAIQVQSANVKIISGATDSSQAFRQSLASALSQAKV